MPAKVTLAVTGGKLQGRVYTFGERTTCLIGRAGDCQLRLPLDLHHRTISRHHCLLDINPPDARIRDLGSLNGTCVNRRKIGQRQRDQTPEEAAGVAFPEYDLRAGDEIALGETTFRVGIILPALCFGCGREIPEGPGAVAEDSSELQVCRACRVTAELPRSHKPPVAAKVCLKCGRDVAAEVGENRQGEFICAECRADPSEIVQLLLTAAHAGDPELGGLRGYTLRRKLGEGGMGAIFLIRHDTTGDQLALKLMLPRVAVQPGARERFLRETENTRALSHRHIVQLRDAGYYRGTFFFTLEYCDEGSVDKLLKKSGRTLPIRAAGALVLQALEGLEYAHDAELPYAYLDSYGSQRGRGLVHRDLKPGNLFLCRSGRSLIAKVGDFGLAKAFDLAGLSGLTMTGGLMGTPAYMPRQQVINFKYARPEVDVWAMAATFYSMVTGVYPRDFPPGEERWLAVLESDPVPIRRRDATIPERIAEVIDHALIDKPAIAFESAAEFRRALEGVL